MGWLQRLGGGDEAGEKGGGGEDAVADNLAEKGWFRVGGLCLRNLYLPPPEGTAEIDLLYLTRKGSFVIESKNYTGWIFGREDQPEWTVSVYAGRDWLGRMKTERHPLYNPIWQNAGHVRALEALVGEQTPLWPVVVFTGRCQLEDVTWDSEEVSVCRLEELPRVLRQTGRRALSRRQVRALYARLEPYTRATRSQKRAHVRQVRRIEREQAKPWGLPGRCPWCGAELVLRPARHGSNAGRRF